MSPLQVAKLAIQWHMANGADPEQVVIDTARTYCFEPWQTNHALDLLRQQVARRNALGYWPEWAWPNG